jgi:probable addiction module antidote protein
MTKLRDYQSWKLKKLSNPTFAAHYLNEVEDSSPELVLAAIQNVVRAREVAAVAKEARVARENIYRAFSEKGNPTMTTFREVLKAVGVKFHFEPIEQATPAPTPTGLASGQSLQATEDALRSMGEESLSTLYLAYIKPNAPRFRPGIGQEQGSLRSAHGRY